MKKVGITLFVTFVSCLSLLAQQGATTTVKFTGKDQYDQWVKLDSVLVENQTRNWQVMFYYPDTTVFFGKVGVDDYDNAQNKVFQNVPNPFNGTTNISLLLNQPEQLVLEIYGLNGVMVAHYSNKLEAGIHLFRAHLTTPQTYLLSAKTQDGMMHIKMVNTGSAGENTIEYVGKDGDVVADLKNGAKGDSQYPFNDGDSMRYKGYATLNGVLFESTEVLKQQNENETISLSFTLPLPTVQTTAATNVDSCVAVLNGNVTSDGGYTVNDRGFLWGTTQELANATRVNVGSGKGKYTYNLTGLEPGQIYYVKAFATNSIGTAYGRLVRFTTQNTADAKPCPNVETVTDYDGNAYNTVLIGKQCWMKENLKTTHYSDGTAIALGNNVSTETSYRYYPNNDSSTVSTCGYLYNWPAVMKDASSSGANPSGVQGICPTGWHVPSDAENTQLIDYVSSQSAFQCDGSSVKIAKALSSTTGWTNSSAACAIGNNPNDNNETGFSAVPSGSYYGTCSDFSRTAYIWSSTQHSSDFAYSYYLFYSKNFVSPCPANKYYGFPVRCLKD